jgi:uncharacterized protein YbbC (DUF1343 family)
MPAIVRNGIDLIEKYWPRQLRSASVGLVVHPASINSSFIHSSDIFLRSRNFSVTAFFGPQHGIKGETQDNMIEWEGYKDKNSGLQVYSLYGRTRKPSSDMLKNLDAVAIDLQDVGSRYYTFIWTMDLVMEATEEFGKSVVILDRPNPINGKTIEGPVLDPKYSSFVGLKPLPIRHGMTVAEIALYLKDNYYPKLDLHIVSMQGWKREMWFDETGLPWVLPSPNMPTVDTAAVYPGICLLEGTNLSEGRGTTRPFEILGAPYIEPDRFVKRLNELRLPGAYFRPLHFQPTFQKHAGKLCGGIQIHLSDRKKFLPFRTAAAILMAAYELYPKKFRWNNPPYEYEKKLLPIDILAGTDRFRRDIEKGISLDRMEERWKTQLIDFNNNFRKKYLIY